jgi:2',3'-cyclic-nucleotide 2'-phosphodiesterase (5'-nucleotidase family)
VLAVSALATLVFAGSGAGHRPLTYGSKAKLKFQSGDAGDARTQKAIMFASDGMRPDLMERYADKGLMPEYKDMLKKGVAGENGLLQGFPPNTGVGWYTLATGTWPAEHGSTNNTFHRTGDAFNNTTSFATTGILQADTLLQSAERAGKKVASVEWVGARGLVPALQGPVVDFRSFFSTRGVLVNYDLAGQPGLANSFGVSYQRTGSADNQTPAYNVPAVADAAGWTNVPASKPGAKETQFRVRNTAFPATDNVDRLYDVYIYDSAGSAAGYDHALLVPSTAGKNGSQSVANLAPGQWQEVKVTLTGARAGQTAGFYTKLIDLTGDLSKLRLYFTSIARVNATYNALGPAGSSAFEETLAHDFPTSTAADFAPLEALIVDEDTYAEQGLKWADAHHAYLHYIFETLNYDPDMLFLGVPVTDEFSHQFLGLLAKTDIDGRPNPYYDDVNGDGTRDGLLAKREGFIQAAYQEADATLGLGRELMGKKDTTVMASSDHGFAPQWLAINARKILFDKTVRNTVTGLDVSLHPSGNPALSGSLSNCRAGLAADLAKACWAGGTTQIYVNPTLPAGITYEAVRTAAKEAFASLTDAGVAGQRPSSTNAQVILKIMNKEELRNVDGTDALHPNRSGDVVVVSRPPYQFDAATAGQNIAFSQFFGQHGYLPELVKINRGVNMHGTFVAAGPGIRKRDDIDDVRAIDVAPTLAFLMGIPAPQNARGAILYKMLTNTGDLRELTILNISDYHGQIVPLLDTPDNISGTGTTNPSFAIGGAAFLKPWFDIYRKEDKNGTLLVAAGDSIGATPPISAFFGDRPTIEMMNMMGFDADGLGNHNFDVGQSYMRGTIAPLANYPFLSANIVDSAGKTPAEWSPSWFFRFGGDTDASVIGFTNDDLPTLTRPGTLDPFHISNSTAAVNAEAARVRGQNRSEYVVAMGHLGATAGTLTAPTGPVVELADATPTLDAVLGDHTDQQILSFRPNGVLLTENRSKGLRFTRIRLVADQDSNEVVYKTADFHKPWNIGVTPEPAIQARLTELQVALNPILGTTVATSSVAVPRSDNCGRADGRLCESKIGNIVTDAMRKTYLTDFAITNSGGLRDALTCPNPDLSGDFCSPFTPPPFPITRGQVLAVLPFGNIVVTASVTGAELKASLENGVSLSNAGAQGRFPQVSGLCFNWDIQAAAGSRVSNVVRQAADGSCTGAPVDLTAGSTYSIAENDFMADGGDGYPVIRPRITTREIMDQALADYVTANSPIAPSIQGRITCTDSNTSAPPACPTPLP